VKQHASQLHAAGFYPPIPVLGELFSGIQAHFLAALTVIIPMGVFNVVGSLQNLESAEAAGDSFETRSSLLANGIGTMAAASFGSCFPTTIYIGHPGWKAMGSRAGYSLLDAGAMALICFTGSLAYVAWAVPIEAGMAIVLYIGVIITAQAFQASPARHAPAAVVGIMVGLGGYVALLAKQCLMLGGYGAGGEVITPELLQTAHQRYDLYLEGAFAMEQGFIFSAMILAALAGALLSFCGLMHGFVYMPGGQTALSLTWDFSSRWAWGYVVLGACMLLAPYVTEPPRAGDDDGAADGMGLGHG
jgi:AGZA family xanthine/uracil permease-like MFS transporter